MVADNLKGGLGATPASAAADLIGAGVCRLQDCSLIAEADHRIANHLGLLAGHLRLKAADLASQSEEPGREVVRLLLVGIEAEISGWAAHLEMLLSALIGVPTRFPFEVFKAAREAYREQVAQLWSGRRSVPVSSRSGYRVTPQKFDPAQGLRSVSPAAGGR